MIDDEDEAMEYDREELEFAEEQHEASVFYEIEER